MHKVFISYHHKNDQEYKDELLKFNEKHNLFIDASVDTGEIPGDWDDQKIRQVIRDDYLKDSTVTILLVGTETKYRKHIDWELYSSMYDGKINKKSGILVVHLPSANCSYFTSTHDGEKEAIYPHIKSWTTVAERTTYDERYPYIPERIKDNLLANDVTISVVNWSDFTKSINNMNFLIEKTFEDRAKCNYDLSRPMRKRNHNI